MKNIISVVMAISVLFVAPEAPAISHWVSFIEKCDSSSLIVYGKVVNMQFLTKEEENSEGRVVQREDVGIIWRIKVDKVFYGDINLKDVFIFEKIPMVEDDLGLIENESLVLFLKEAQLEPELIEKFHLNDKKIFVGVAGDQSAEVITSEKRPVSSTNKDTLFQALEISCAIKALKDNNQKIEKWKKLLKSDNLILRESAKFKLNK